MFCIDIKIARFKESGKIDFVLSMETSYFYNTSTSNIMLCKLATSIAL